MAPLPPAYGDPGAWRFPGATEGATLGYLLEKRIGKLVLSEGCVSIGGGKGNPEVLIWPAGYYLNQVEDRVQILDYRGKVVARIGDWVEMGGGEAPPRSEWVCALREPVPPCVQRMKAYMVSEISRVLPGPPVLPIPTPTPYPGPPEIRPWFFRSGPP